MELYFFLGLVTVVSAVAGYLCTGCVVKAVVGALFALACIWVLEKMVGGFVDISDPDGGGDDV